VFICDTLLSPEAAACRSRSRGRGRPYPRGPLRSRQIRQPRTNLVGPPTGIVGQATIPSGATTRATRWLCSQMTARRRPC